MYIQYQPWISLWVHAGVSLKRLTDSGAPEGWLVLYKSIAGCHGITLITVKLEFFFIWGFLILSQLLAMDASARVTMKDAAKCDKRREWQNSENQENAERILHFQVIPGSMSTSGR